VHFGGFAVTTISVFKDQDRPGMLLLETATPLPVGAWKEEMLWKPLECTLVLVRMDIGYKTYRVRSNPLSSSSISLTLGSSIFGGDGFREGLPARAL